MSRRKIPENETPEEKTTRILFEQIVSVPSKEEKLNWTRKNKKMQDIIVNLSTLEQEILNLQEAALPIYDKLALIREDMVETCVHPFDLLVEKDGYVECKFCGKKLAV